MFSFGQRQRGEASRRRGQVYRLPRDGMDLMLTVDRTIQAVLEPESDQAMAQHQLEYVLGDRL